MNSSPKTKEAVSNLISISKYKPQNKFNLEPSKQSTRSYSIIKGYAANTNIGLVRTKNEDRVTVIVNMQKPVNYPKEEK